MDPVYVMSYIIYYIRTVNINYTHTQICLDDPICILSIYQYLFYSICVCFLNIYSIYLTLISPSHHFTPNTHGPHPFSRVGLPRQTWCCEKWHTHTQCFNGEAANELYVSNLGIPYKDEQTNTYGSGIVVSYHFLSSHIHVHWYVPIQPPQLVCFCGSRLKDQGWYAHSAVANVTSKSQQLPLQHKSFRQKKTLSNFMLT